MGGNFKSHVQDSDLEYLFWRFEKRITLSEKKLPLAATGLLVFIHLKARNDASSPHRKPAACMADTTDYTDTPRINP